MSTQFIQCVAVWCILSTNDNCLTSENHPLGIVRILIPQTHSLNLIYPFINLRISNIHMAPGPRLRPALYCNHRITDEDSDVVTRVQITYEQLIWTMAVAQLKMVPKNSFILHTKSFHILFYFLTCAVVVEMCAVTACWGSASKDWCSRVIAG